MIVAKCPECGTTLKAFTSDSVFFDWVKCSQCYTPSFVVLDEYGELKVVSFPKMWEKFSPSVRKAIKLLLVKNRSLKELEFLAGRDFEDHEAELESLKIMVHKGREYSLNPILVNSAKGL